MTDKLQRISNDGAALATQVPADRVRRLLEFSLRSKSANTLRSYQASLRVFADWLSIPDINEAVTHILRLGPAEANLLVLDFMDHMKSAGLSKRTIAARVAAIKSVVKDAQTAEIIHWNLAVKVQKVPKRSAVRGPTPEEFGRIKRVVDDDVGRLVGKRNRAIVYLMAFGAYRREEIVSLDVGHFDRKRRQLFVLRKGSDDERVWRTLGRYTYDAICAYLDAAGHASGPLFQNADRSGKGKDTRLTGTSVYRIVKSIGKKAGVPDLHPHAFRHFSATEILEVTDGNTRLAQKHTGHANPAMLDVYEDERQDHVKRAADLVESRWFDDDQ